MNVEIGKEAAQFPEKAYINGIFLAVCPTEYKECHFHLPASKWLPPTPPTFWALGEDTRLRGGGRTKFGRLARNFGAMYPKIPLRSARIVLENAGIKSLALANGLADFFIL